MKMPLSLSKSSKSPLVLRLTVISVQFTELHVATRSWKSVCQLIKASCFASFLSALLNTCCFTATNDAIYEHV